MRLADTGADEPRFPVDPYSTEYWEDTKVEPMGPPRGPLNVLTAMTNAQLHVPAPHQKPQGKAFKAAPAQSKPVPEDLMDSFKAAIKGSPLSKVGLTEVLKKQ